MLYAADGAQLCPDNPTSKKRVLISIVGPQAGFGGPRFPGNEVSQRSQNLVPSFRYCKNSARTQFIYQGLPHRKETAMPPKSSTGAPVRRTADLQMPTKSDGTKDQRYNYPQFTNKDGTRDMRTTASSAKK
jgi:hypothetical protein